MTILLTLIGSTLSACCARDYSASEIKADERVIFFPTAARLSADGRTWIARVHGWIFEPETDSRWRAAFKRSLGEAMRREGSEPAADQGQAAASEFIEQRVSSFLMDNERGKQISVRVGDTIYTLPESEADGHFAGEIKIPVAQARPLTTAGCLRFAAVTRIADERDFAGTVALIEPDGVSVVSDIDDTIKISEVRNRQRLLDNTFRLPYRAVPGMADLYRDWAQAGRRFHFVSNSPWQLYESLQQFSQEAGFPPATWELRRFRSKDPTSIRDLFSDAGQAKRKAIERLLQDYPRRRFVLIGDSGEADPEIYGAIARQFPGRVSEIFIRDVTDESADGPRYRQAFAGLDSVTWQLFKDPAVLPQ